MILVITMKKWYLIFLLSQWCVLLTGEPGRSVMSATKAKNGDWSRTMAGLLGTATSRLVVLVLSLSAQSVVCSSW